MTVLELKSEQEVKQVKKKQPKLECFRTNALLYIIKDNNNIMTKELLSKSSNF